MKVIAKGLLIPIAVVVPSLALANTWNVTTDVIADQTNASWIGVEPTQNINVQTGGSLIFKVTESTEKDMGMIAVSSVEPTSAYYGVDEASYDSGARLTLNLATVSSPIKFSNGGASTLTFGKGTTVNLTSFKNGVFGSSGSTLVFDGASLNIQNNFAGTSYFNVVNAASDSASVYFKNGASFNSSPDDPTKTVALYAGRGEGLAHHFMCKAGPNFPLPT